MEGCKRVCLAALDDAVLAKRPKSEANGHAVQFAAFDEAVLTKWPKPKGHAAQPAQRHPGWAASEGGTARWAACACCRGRGSITIYTGGSRTCPLCANQGWFVVSG
mmetsp:Transcript_28788/g.72342  ORF Transcript_28788/g.72342 Transcript_28788/m.72342 type:complete len:106 (-) Transcript_28788:548-865(-)